MAKYPQRIYERYQEIQKNADLTINEKGYYVNRKTKRLFHREIAYQLIYNLKDHEIPFSDLQVHHIDFDKKNNHPDNLLICTQEEHDRIHKKQAEARARKHEPVYDDSWKENEDSIYAEIHALEKAEKEKIKQRRTLKPSEPQHRKVIAWHPPQKRRLSKTHVLAIAIACALVLFFFMNSTNDSTSKTMTFDLMSTETEKRDCYAEYANTPSRLLGYCLDQCKNFKGANADCLSREKLKCTCF